MVAGRRGGAQGAVGAAAGARGMRDAPRPGARVDRGLRGPPCASSSARVRRCTRKRSITVSWLMNATTRMADRARARVDLRLDAAIAPGKR